MPLSLSLEFSELTIIILVFGRKLEPIHTPGEHAERTQTARTFLLVQERMIVI